MRSAWKVLKLPRTGVILPPLLIKYEIGTSDYSVWVTDLTLIWRESLDRKRIIRRSLDVDTSIDPSEDSDQLQLFLRRVGDALDQQAITTLDLVQNERDQSLLLQTCTPLPGSLRPLEWFVELLPDSQTTLTAELVVPMLSQQMFANAEKASLLQQLKEKDQVIAKLVDKMQSEGVNLSKLCPGVVPKSSKPMSRQALGRSVKGFAEFNEHQWRGHLMNSIASPKEFIEVVTDALDIDLGAQPEIAQMPECTNWWKKLSHKNSQTNGLAKDIRHTSTGIVVTQDEPQGDSDDRVSTPMRLRNPSPARKRREESAELDDLKVEARNQLQHNSDSTTDESDQDLRSPRPKSVSRKEKSPDHVAAQNTSDNKAGRGNQQNSMPIRAADVSADHFSSSDGEGTQLGLSAVKRSIPYQAASSKPRAKLGKIGGKGTAGKSSEAPPYTGQNLPANAGRSSRSEDLPPSTELGAIPKAEAESEPGSRTTVQPQPSSPPRETSPERANRNREKLKRELETKVQAGAKRKRRF